MGDAGNQGNQPSGKGGRTLHVKLITLLVESTAVAPVVNTILEVWIENLHGYGTVGKVVHFAINQECIPSVIKMHPSGCAL